jgi:hypothetical protein
MYTRPPTTGELAREPNVTLCFADVKPKDGLAGIDLTAAGEDEILAGGLQTTGRAATVQPELPQGEDSRAWAPTSTFATPGLGPSLGLAGLDPFLVSIDAYEGVGRAPPSAPMITGTGFGP